MLRLSQPVPALSEPQSPFWWLRWVPAVVCLVLLLDERSVWAFVIPLPPPSGTDRLGTHAACLSASCLDARHSISSFHDCTNDVAPSSCRWAARASALMPAVAHRAGS